MPQRLEHIEAAKAEAIRLGATFSLERGGKHLIGVIYYNGQHRKTSLSASPSRLASLKTIKYVRRAIEEMKK